MLQVALIFSRTETFELPDTTPDFDAGLDQLVPTFNFGAVVFLFLLILLDVFQIYGALTFLQWPIVVSFVVCLLLLKLKSSQKIRKWQQSFLCQKVIT